MIPEEDGLLTCYVGDLADNEEEMVVVDYDAFANGSGAAAVAIADSHFVYEENFTVAPLDKEEEAAQFQTVGTKKKCSI